MSTIVCPHCSERVHANTPEERFWLKVDKNGPEPDNKNCVGRCWIWCGPVKETYGMWYKGQLRIPAHREAWEYYNKQKVPNDKVVRHMCDNRLCVNPVHLLIGTSADNVRDMVERGRYVPSRLGNMLSDISIFAREVITS